LNEPPASVENRLRRLAIRCSAVVVVPDPTTFLVLPWADRTGWMICDVYFAGGTPVPLDGRAQLRTQLPRLRESQSMPALGA
jgi:glutamine synthetase